MANLTTIGLSARCLSSPVKDRPMITVRPYVTGQLITEPGVYSGVPMSAYHGPRLVDGPKISSSGLRTIFNESALDYWRTASWNPLRAEPKDTDAFTLGRAAHHLMLGEPHFKKHFAVRPPQFDSWRTDKSKIWRAEQELAGMTVLTDDDIESVRGMAGLLEWQKGRENSGVLNCDVVVNGGLLNGKIEHSIIWRDKETGVWLCSRPDAIPVHDGVFSDFKSTRDASDVGVQKSLGEFRYDMQGALARVGMREVCGIDLTNFAFVFVKKTDPFSVNPVEIRADHMDAAESDLRATIKYFARCLDRDIWPAKVGKRAEAITMVGLSPWDRKKADERRAAIEQDLAA